MVKLYNKWSKKVKKLVAVVVCITGFEGGQTPLFRRLQNVDLQTSTLKEYAVVNLDQLNAFERWC